MSLTIEQAQTLVDTLDLNRSYRMQIAVDGGSPGHPGDDGIKQLFAEVLEGELIYYVMGADAVMTHDLDEAVDAYNEMAKAPRI